MRRYYILLILAIFLQACSGIPFQDGLFPPTDTPLPTSTATVTYTPSITPTSTITPTITPSPTIVHFPTQDPNLPTETFVPIPIFSGENTITPVPTATTFRPGPGFLSVEISESKMFWGICKPNKSIVTAKVEDPDTVASVVIFVQVKNSWVNMQLVATDDEGKEIGRTRIYTELVAMSPCMCLEPLKGCPIVTPKP